MVPRPQLVAAETVDSAVSSWFAALERLTAGAPGGRVEKSAQGTWVLVCGIDVETANGVFSASRRPNIVQMALRADNIADLDLPWCVQVRGEPASELLVVAARHGLTRRRQVPFMICDPELVKYSADPTASIRTLSSAENGLYVDTLATALELPADMFGDIYGDHVLDADGVTAYLVEVDGHPVATGLTVQVNGRAGIFNVATVPGFRGRGYGRAVSERMLRDSFAAGATQAFLTATDAALPLYESIGLQTAECWTYLTRPE